MRVLSQAPDGSCFLSAKKKKKKNQNVRVVWKTVCPRVLFFAVKVVKEFALSECTF